MKTWHFYDLATGIFTGRSFGPTEDGCVNGSCFPGEGAKCDVAGWESQRVDVETDQVVDYQPPAPDADHEWIHDDAQGNRVRRWVLKPDAVERRNRRSMAIARIAELERKQERAMREHLLGISPTEEDRAAGAMTLQEIQDAISEQRAIIAANESVSTPIG